MDQLTLTYDVHASTGNHTNCNFLYDLPEMDHTGSNRRSSERIRRLE